MKTTKLILAGLAATASLLSLSQAQSTVAVTDPVGYITIDIKAPGILSFIAPTLVNKVEFSGAVSSAAGTTLNVTGLTAGAYNKSTAVLDGAPARYTHYVEITNPGSTAGVWANIESNTATGIVTQDNLSSMVTASTTITVRKHVTVGDFFGATNTAGLNASDQLSSADEVKILNSETKAITSVFYFNDGSFQGWVDADFIDAGNLPLEPGQGLYVQRKSGSAVSFTRVGHVKTGATMVTADPGINIVSVPLATGITLANSNLTNDLPAQGGRVKSSDAIDSADVLKIQQASGGLKEFFHFDDGSFKGWVDADFLEAGTENLKEGTSFVLVRKPVGTLTWTAPAQVIQN